MKNIKNKNQKVSIINIGSDNGYDLSGKWKSCANQSYPSWTIFYFLLLHNIFVYNEKSKTTEICC
jgi:hypothetical protein